MTKLPPLGGPHDALRTLMGEIGSAVEGTSDAGVRIAADFLGMNRGTLHRNLDADASEAEISFVRVAMLTDRFKTPAAAVFLARKLGCELVPIRPGIHAGTPLNALAHMVKETSEAVSAVADWAQQPEATTRNRRRQVITEIDQAIEALLEVRARIAPAPEDSGP